MSTKASNPRCKINFGNLTYRILILQTTWFWLFGHVFAGSWDKIQIRFWDPYPPNHLVYSVFAWFWDKIQIQFWDPYPPNHLVYSKFAWFWEKIQIQFLDPDPPNISKPPCLQFICMILGLNLDSVFGSWSSKPVALQRICMILGLNLDSVFGSWSFKKKDETNVYKCLQKPLIHDVKLILEILLFGSWPSKLPGFECFCMILWLNPNSVLGSLSSKPPCLQCICMILGLNLDSVFESWSSKPAGLQRICMILGLDLDSVFGSWSFKKKDDTNVFKSFSSTMQN